MIASNNHKSVESISIEIYSGDSGTLYLAKMSQIFFDVRKCLCRLIEEFSLLPSNNK